MMADSLSPSSSSDQPSGNGVALNASHVDEAAEAATPEEDNATPTAASKKTSSKPSDRLHPLPISHHHQAALGNSTPSPQPRSFLRLPPGMTSSSVNSESSSIAAHSLAASSLRFVPPQVALSSPVSRKESQAARSVSATTAPLSRAGPPSIAFTPTRAASPFRTTSRGSVKHLTCFWWKDKGHCRFSEEECLYAHHDTGLYTDPPRQVVAGQPALAGRSLDRALRKLQLNHQRSTSSLSNASASRPSTPTIATTPVTIPFTPLSAMPVRLHDPQQAYAQFTGMLSDNALLRGLADQNVREKSVLLNTIDGLQNENKGEHPGFAVPQGPS